MSLPPVLRRALWSALFVVALSSSSLAQDGTAPANQDGDPTTPAPPTTPSVTPPVEKPVPAPTDEPPPTGLVVGADLYYGVSNLPGVPRFRDGFWTGLGSFYPSNLYAAYSAANGTTAKVSVSVGELYNGSVPGFDQPIEAYVSKPLRGTTITAGKFFVPFELAEWEYESEFGLQAARDWGNKGNLTGAVTYNRIVENPNFYARYARSFGPATLGVSLGAGRGFIGDTDHDRGGALDLTVEHRRLRFESTALLAQKSDSSSRFLFAFARLNYQLDPRTKFYISRHSWHDRLDQQGNGQFSTLGAVYQIDKHLAVEAATSRAGQINQTVNWIQLHYTIER